MVIAALGVVAVNVILELMNVRPTMKGFFFPKVIHNSSLFSDVFDFPSHTSQQYNGFLSTLLEILVGKYASICEYLFKGHLLSKGKASLDSSRKH